MVLHSSFADFVLFLYVHVAHIDSTYDPKEILTIKSKMSALFPEGTDLERKLYQTIREYNEFDRNKIGELCRDSFAHFGKDIAAKNTKLFEDVKEIIDADGKVHELEAEALKALKNLIEK